MYINLFYYFLKVFLNIFMIFELFMFNRDFDIFLQYFQYIHKIQVPLYSYLPIF